MKFELQNLYYNPAVFPDEPKGYEITLLNFSKDSRGVWSLMYERSGTICMRYMLDSRGLHIERRKPIGQEAIDVVEELLRRKLTSREAEYVMRDVKLIG